jgi:hypothetical protein
MAAGRFAGSGSVAGFRLIAARWAPTVRPCTLGRPESVWCYGSHDWESCTRAISFARNEKEKHTASDFRIIAVDLAGKRHEAKSQSGASAGGNGMVVVTLVAGFDLASDKVDALVIQPRERK